MAAPGGYRPTTGDVILVRATVSRVTGPEVDWAEEAIAVAAGEAGTVKIAARTETGALVRCAIDDIEKVEAFAIDKGSRVRWHEDSKPLGGGSYLPAGWVYGTVLSVEKAEDEADRPAKDNLWIKVDGKWERRTFMRHQVERA